MFISIRSPVKLFISNTQSHKAGVRSYTAATAEQFKEIYTQLLHASSSLDKPLCLDVDYNYAL